MWYNERSVQMNFKHAIPLGRNKFINEMLLITGIIAYKTTTHYIKFDKLKILEFMTLLNYITDYDDINLQKDEDEIVKKTPTACNNDVHKITITPVVSSLSKFEKIEQLKNELKLLQDDLEEQQPVKKSSVKINTFCNTVDNSVF